MGPMKDIKDNCEKEKIHEILRYAGVQFTRLSYAKGLMGKGITCLRIGSVNAGRIRAA